MSRESNFINVIDALETIATNHRQIHSFGFGEVANINTSGSIDYIGMWVKPLASLARNGEVGYKVQIIIMDIEQRDLSNERDVLNDTLQVAMDVAADIKMNGIKASGAELPFEMKQDYEVEFIPFMERFDEFTAGWNFDIEVWARWDWSECDIPKDDNTSSSSDTEPEPEPEPEFSPTDIAGLVLWVHGDTETAGALASWMDQSGNANHLTQAVGAAQPMVVASVIDGHNVVRFDGINDFLESPSVTLSIRTEFFVIKKNGAAGNSYHGIISQAMGDFYQLYVPSTFNSYIGVNRDHLTTFDSSFTLIRRVISASSVNVFKNGVAGTAGSHSGGSLSSLMYVGAFPGNGYSNADIAEIIIYNTDLSASDITDVEDYLNTKYPSM